MKEYIDFLINFIKENEFMYSFFIKQKKEMRRIDININFDDKLIEVFDTNYHDKLWWCFSLNDFNYCGFKKENVLTNKKGKLKKLKINQKKVDELKNKIIKEIKKNIQKLENRKKESRRYNWKKIKSNIEFIPGRLFLTGEYFIEFCGTFDCNNNYNLKYFIGYSDELIDIFEEIVFNNKIDLTELKKLIVL